MMKTIENLAFATIVVACLGGCSGPSLIVLHNPATGQMAQCQDDAGYYGTPHRVEQCAKAYEKAGWVRLTPGK